MTQSNRDLHRALRACLVLLSGVGAFMAEASATPVYWSGHSDIVPLYDAVSQSLELKIRFDGNSKFEGGESYSFQQFAPEAVAIRIPDPAILRGVDPEGEYDNSGLEWDFLGLPVDDEFWLLPQSSVPSKPFFGFATDTLPFGQWTGPVTWSLEEVVTVPEGAEVSLWQTGFFGDPTPLYASYDGIDAEEDSFPQGIGGHDHYNWGFTKPGVYRLALGATATHSSAGEVHGVATFTFLVGDEAAPLTPGDYNADGRVDAADYTVWRDTFGETGAALAADGDLSGAVDEADYDLWATNYGAGVSGGASATHGVPEPTTLALIVVGVICGYSPSRRRLDHLLTLK